MTTPTSNGDPNGSHHHGDGTLSKLAQFLNVVRRDIVSQGTHIKSDLGLAVGAGEALLSGGEVNDRKYLVERVIQLAASLPNDSKLRSDLNAKFIGTLWRNLQHPPISYLGDEFRYRSADGSNNNFMYPQLGASGSHYARTVKPMYRQAVELPDPGVIFDSLLARGDVVKEHPAKVSSSLLHFATIIIHDLFHTNSQDVTRTQTSSYLDLGPLYGHNEEQQKMIRTFKDGLLKKDAFSEPRILGQPPGVGALLISFNRFHNYIAGQLAEINERGRFSIPSAMAQDSPEYSAAQTKRDNDLFQTARLITCGLYVNVIIGDYLRTILNLNRNPVHSDWKLDPREDFNDIFDQEGVPKGIGNQVSVEFNMIYRWHSAISAEDERWTEDAFKRLFGPDVDWDTLSVDELLIGLRKRGINQSDDPGEWDFSGFKRQEDGSFKDEDLVQALQEGTDNIAGAFGAHNIPRVLRAVEILGIQQGRQWDLASLNEFRKFCKLKPYTSFADINPDPKVAEALESLYEHPDNVELYPGILSEATKEGMAPGSGLCPGFTTSFAILSDAVALVRGDRFYTVDYSPSNLTAFGYAEVDSDYDVAGGGVMYKLLMRAFPAWYRANSVYALYPFTTPEGIKETFSSQVNAPDVSYDKPLFVGPPTPVLSWVGVTNTLADQAELHVPWGPHSFQLTQHDYMLSGDSAKNAEQRTYVNKCLYSPEDGIAQVRRFYEATTARFIKQNSRKVGKSYQLDIVRDVGNLVHSAFCSNFFGIPLRGHGGKDDSYTEASLAETLGNLFSYVFLDLDTAQSYKRRVVAFRQTQKLGQVMQKIVTDVKNKKRSVLCPAKGTENFLESYGPHLIERLLESAGGSVDDTVWTIIPTAAASSATQGQGWGQMIDLYLSDKYFVHWPAIQELALSDDPEDFNKLRRYALEGFRLCTPAFGLVRNAVADNVQITDGPRTESVGKGDTVFADFITAGRDPAKFPDPEEIKLDRPDSSYIHHGWGPHACLGREIVTEAGASMLRVCAKLVNFRRAAGSAGEMKATLVNGAFKRFLSEDGSQWGPFPVNKQVVFDDFGPI
ncbi:heme peroxidase family protein [Emericellopsis atlantica]|uniref:Heme peroxidase family protein n=1 Tax=Emericellopsis atlantica TaxID=2614577 RepID=A0A9P8CPG8_9HYPO|nr:heme peroxidase family protein [Emericellopsis atlantica]KAG9254518.1 heme peroxidase family protein [Emericellopsis atlantica]